MGQLLLPVEEEERPGEDSSLASLDWERAPFLHGADFASTFDGVRGGRRLNHPRPWCFCGLRRPVIIDLWKSRGRASELARLLLAISALSVATGLLWVQEAMD